jgi:N-methylhydantoinase B/oxoprolinase/acetone carboxylase alpha subunit
MAAVVTPKAGAWIIKLAAAGAAAAGDLLVIETLGGGGYGAPCGSGAPGVTDGYCDAFDRCDALWSA